MEKDRVHGSSVRSNVRFVEQSRMGQGTLLLIPPCLHCRADKQQGSAIPNPPPLSPKCL